MSRHPRVHAEGVLYHVMARGNKGQKIFLSESDYEAFLEALGAVRKRYPFYLYAYVLMSNHFHLLMEVQRSPTARIMQSLLTGYVRHFNKIHRRRGYLFEGRYKAIICERQSYLLELLRYIHLNAVRAGLVERPGEWPWSGHGEYLGKEKRSLIDPGPVLGELSTAARYEAFIREGVRESYRAEWHPGERSPFLGAEQFKNEIVKEQSLPPPSRRTPLKELLKRAATNSGMEPRTIERKGRTAKTVETRDRFICQAVLEQGYLAAEVARFLGCHQSNISRALQKNI